MSEVIRKQLFLLFFVLSILALLAGCSRYGDRAKAQIIFAEMNQLIDEGGLVAKETLARPQIFSEEYLKDFPANREQLEITAKEQINSFQRINKLDELQLEKWEELSKLNPEGNAEKWQRECELQKQLQQKRMEDVDLGIEKFGLILDKNIKTRQQLNERILQIKQKQSSIDREIERLQNLRRENKEGR